MIDIERFDLAVRVLTAQHERVTAMSQALDDLVREVTEINDVVQSAITLISGLRQQLVDAGTDQVKLAQLATDLDTTAGALAAAVAATGTPAPAPAPAPAPPPAV